ncbi:MAG: hypothetical protein KGN79_05355 [Acidobacteriota bacterium]|nr:hypothetical protein [Acidobacteriota bacterium]
MAALQVRGDEFVDNLAGKAAMAGLAMNSWPQGVGLSSKKWKVPPEGNNRHCMEQTLAGRSPECIACSGPLHQRVR